MLPLRKVQDHPVVNVVERLITRTLYVMYNITRKRNARGELRLDFHQSRLSLFDAGKITRENNYAFQLIQTVQINLLVHLGGHLSTIRRRHWAGSSNGFGNSRCLHRRVHLWGFLLLPVGWAFILIDARRWFTDHHSPLFHTGGVFNVRPEVRSKTKNSLIPVNFQLWAR